MNFSKKIVLLSTFLFCYNLTANSAEITRLFYLQRTDTISNVDDAKAGFESFKNHYNVMNIVAPQAYQVDANGIVWGYVDPQVVSLAKEHSVKLMPLLTNASFDKEKTHLFLQNDAAQNRAAQSLRKACQQYHYYGMQLDFENVAMNDKEGLTRFYTLAAKVLHEAGYKVSFALPPMLTDNPTPSYIQKKFYENWEAAYDFQTLGKAADFVTIMAYNQHGDGTTPGPSADIHWVETTIKYALNHIPANKISLGIPAWSDYWFTDRVSGSNRIRTQHIVLKYRDLMYLLGKFDINLQWDDNNKLSYKMFTHDWLNQYVFAEDVNSYAAKKALAEKYHLAGISLYALGMEDPKIWN
jgi:spore germination protein YaaH